MSESGSPVSPVQNIVTRHSRIPLSFVLLTCVVGYQGLIDWKHKSQIASLRADLTTVRDASVETFTEVFEKLPQDERMAVQGPNGTVYLDRTDNPERFSFSANQQP